VVRHKTCVSVGGIVDAPVSTAAADKSYVVIILFLSKLFGSKILPRLTEVLRIARRRALAPSFCLSRATLDTWWWSWALARYILVWRRPDNRLWLFDHGTCRSCLARIIPWLNCIIPLLHEYRPLV